MRKLFRALLIPLALLALPAAASPASPANPMSTQIRQFQRAFPGVHLLVLSGDAPRQREAARLRLFLRENGIPQRPLLRDRELRALLTGRRHYEMEPTNWSLDTDPAHTVCLTTLDRSDYRRAGGSYWKTSWGVRDRHLGLQLDPAQVGEWNFDHEMYHCLAPHLGLARGGDGLLHILYEESAADTFAALVHLQQSGDRGMIQADAAMRQMYAVEDTEHYTTPALRYLLARPQRYSQSALAGRPLRDLAVMAHRIVTAAWPELSREALRAARDPHAGRAIHRAGMAMFRRLQDQQG